MDLSRAAVFQVAGLRNEPRSKFLILEKLLCNAITEPSERGPGKWRYLQAFASIQSLERKVVAISNLEGWRVRPDESAVELV